MTETVILEARETRRSFGPPWLALSVLVLGLPFLGRQGVTVTNERITVTPGFWTKVRDDIEIFRIRDVVVKLQRPGIRDAMHLRADVQALVDDALKSA